ncbi:hypothetical protein DFJ74DRAFT_771296 [Hyaloraphidium curvatum]|nr:hypothetical protein DFJ74DRAFT_771296 [Hyaloraphidium curvatum]
MRGNSSVMESAEAKGGAEFRSNAAGGPDVHGGQVRLDGHSGRQTPSSMLFPEVLQKHSQLPLRLPCDPSTCSAITRLASLDAGAAGSSEHDAGHRGLQQGMSFPASSPRELFRIPSRIDDFAHARCPGTSRIDGRRAYGRRAVPDQIDRVRNVRRGLTFSVSRSSVPCRPPAPSDLRRHMDDGPDNGGGTAPPPPLCFSPAEWAAIFPFPDTAGPTLSPLPRADDPGAAVRAADALTPAAIFDGLRGAGLLRALVRAQFWLAPWAANGLLRYSLQAFPQLALLGTDWYLNGLAGSPFGRPQMAAGTAALVWAIMGSGFLPNLAATAIISHTYGLAHMSDGKAFVAAAIAVEIVAMCMTAFLRHRDAGLHDCLLYFFLDMSILASANACISSVLDLYREARTAIRDIVLRAVATHPAPLDANIRHALDLLDRHDWLLSSLAEAGADRARLLGVPIDYAVLRTLALTLFTLGVGLWSVLRGGVGFTFDNFCPYRP